MDKVDLAVVVAEITSGMDSLYQNTSKQRILLLEFMAANDWFGADYAIKKRSALIATNDVERFKNHLTLWLAAFRQPGSVKIALMLKFFEQKYPRFCEAYTRYINEKDVDAAPRYWHLLDYLLSEIGKDISEYTDEDIRSLSLRLNEDVPLSVADAYSEFVATVRIDGRPLSKWIYRFEPRGNSELNTSAYELNDFAFMAYYIFNREAWDEHSLIQKALSNRIYAELWLSSAFYFICALRKTDIARFPAPELPDPTNVRLQLERGLFPDNTAAMLCDELVTRIKLLSLTPSKTAAHSSVADIKFSVPETLRVAVGTILAVVLVHHPETKPGDAFIVPRKEIRYIRAFFGDTFADALGNRNLDSRRANKAYLQGIDLVANAEGTPGRPKGYMLASLARSHKGGIGTLSQTTDIYLKDANFRGYTPEFIAREMFERGVFSFIPAILLEMYAGSKYRALPVGVQTKLIEALGLTAAQIEWIANTVEVSLTQSKRVVTDFFAGTPDIQENVFRVLQNIASGNAPGKQSEYLCLMAAATRRCPYRDRTGCVGCNYEILTKAAIHSLMREYVRISALRDNANNAESNRYGKLLETAVLPAVAEFMTSAQRLYPDVNTTILLDIVEEGVNYANHKTREIGEQPRTLASNITA